jgi:hypothetical protein
MDPTAITRFLDNIMGTPNAHISGAILVDASSGLCLGAKGKAREDDAAQLTIASRTACDSMGVGVVTVRGERVVLKHGKDVLVGVWKDF